MNLPPKVDFESEITLLQEIHAGHATRMRDTGLLGRALRAAGLEEEGTINPVLYRVNRNKASGPDVQYVELRLTGTNERGITIPRHLAVTESLGSGTLPVEPFTPEDADEVQAMMNGLAEARDFGFLPHLSPTMDHITNPYTALTISPKPPSEKA